MPLLEIQDLQTHFRKPGGTIKAVDGVSLSINAGEIVALVGESGCGKSVTAFSILGLIPDPPGRIVGGRILFDGRDLRAMLASEMRKIRGGGIGMVFQDPMTSLNPALTVGDQIAEAVLTHKNIGHQAAMERVVELLERVKVPDVMRRINEYPHRLSGGMRQRVMIAMALACEPKLLIADEPTTALDVTIQAQILQLLCEIRDKTGTAVLLITHDFGVVAEIADRVAVMYSGRKVEEAPVSEIFMNPRHPYTKGLLHSIPHPDQDQGIRKPLREIAGMVPPLDHLPPGCAFAPRCPKVKDICTVEIPRLLLSGKSQVACFFAEPELACDDGTVT